MTDEIQKLKEEEKAAAGNLIDTGQVIGSRPVTRHRRQRRRRPHAERPSFFGPIVLIGVGVYFLLTNLNVIDGSLNWNALFRLWPVFLIFMGLNIIARQIPGVLGSLGSALVGLTAVALAGAVLFFADRLPYVDSLAGQAANLQRHTLERPLGEAASAEVVLDAGSLPLTLSALSDSRNLIEGDISTSGELIETFEVDGDRIRYTLDERSVIWWGGTSWDGDDRWDIRLSPRLPIDLRLDLSSGASDIDLSRLQLEHLEIDGGSGASSIALPAGTYQAHFHMGSGASRISLPSEGEIFLEVDGGSGALRLILPASMAARIEVEHGSGRFAPGDRFSLVEGERHGDGIWETEGYEPNARNRIDLKIDLGSGSIVISEVAPE